MKLFYRSIFLFFVSVLLLSNPQRLFAQKIDIKWGPEFKDAGKTSFGTIIGEDDEYYYVLKTKYKGLFGDADYVFERYSLDHKLTKGQELKIKTPQGKDADFEKIYQLDDKFILLFRYYDSKADMNILYAVNIDKSGKQDKPVIVDKEPAKKEKKSGSYSFILSEDKTKLLVIRIAAYDKKGSEKFKYIMLKSNLENLWEKEVELPYKDKNFEIEKYVIDETGNVFLLGNYKIDRNDKYANYKVFAYDYANDKLEEIKVNFGKSMYIGQLKFFYNATGLHILGFYADKKASGFSGGSGITGIFYNRINSKTFAVDYERAEAFDKKTLAKFMSDRRVNKGKGIDNTFKITDILVRDNGTIQLIAENYYVHVVTSQMSNGVTVTTYYYYNLDLIALQFNKDGKVDWVTRIPKFQYSRNDGALYSSYLMAFDKDNIYLLYNDNPKNALARPKSGQEREAVKVAKLNKVHKSAIMVATIGSNGELKRELYAKQKEKGKTAFVASNYSRMNKDKIWIVGVKGKLRKYGFLTLKGNDV